MNREDYFRRACLLHTQCGRSLKGVVSSPAHLHKQQTCGLMKATDMALMKAMCKCHPERRKNRLKRGNMAGFTL